MSKLVVSFLDPSAVEDFVGRLRSDFDLASSSILFYEVEDSDNIMAAYNLNLRPSDVFPPSSLMVHRKSKYACFYTINGLNALVRELNGGHYDSNYWVDWSQYRDTFITYRKGVFRIQKISFYKRLDF